ncbi:Glyco-hydro-114 domain containing protein [Pyrenophora tritici-repentis]|uniref:alpha-galactosidase n=1 Tax=Pyrenophora tritici-repentis TaxID=45151 RepID=A0A922N005_9PLEO|nr:Glyco-hydro-114 domain containing protein [Pyrenophora tritici-repentis]KAI1678156.1 Glyco-hydro-114 domain containing protein [Pyrenophora tritici-repentis]
MFPVLLSLLWVALLTGRTLAQNATFTRGQKFQIILLGVPDVSKMPLPPTDAPVWDVDLFDTPVTTISALKKAGKTVICYFSAGTAENWRDDYGGFAAADLGKVLPEWSNEKWVKTGSQGIRNIMAKRIKLAADKGCDAIDPDNTDGYQNESGLSLTPADAISYLTFLAATATTHSLSIGLKNSLSILPSVSPLIDFAVNEQCFQLGECTAYTTFLASNKPVFNIEYPQPLNAASVQGSACRNPVVDGMSTVLKDLTLDGRTVYCDGGGVVVDTPTVGGSSSPRPSRPPMPVYGDAQSDGYVYAETDEYIYAATDGCAGWWRV